MAADIVALAMVSSDRFIDGRPWENAPDGADWLTEQAKGSPVIMGKTAKDSDAPKCIGYVPRESLEIVISPKLDKKYRGARSVWKPASALTIALTKSSAIYVIGGESTHRAFSKLYTDAIIVESPEPTGGNKALPNEIIDGMYEESVDKLPDGSIARTYTTKDWDQP